MQKWNIYLAKYLQHDFCQKNCFFFLKFALQLFCQLSVEREAQKIKKIIVWDSFHNLYRLPIINCLITISNRPRDWGWNESLVPRQKPKNPVGSLSWKKKINLHHPQAHALLLKSFCCRSALPTEMKNRRIKRWWGPHWWNTRKTLHRTASKRLSYIITNWLCYYYYRVIIAITILLLWSIILLENIITVGHF